MGQPDGLMEWLASCMDEDEAVARDALLADLPARWETEHGGVCTAEAYDRPGYSQDGEKIPIARVLGTVGEFRTEMRNAEHIARQDPASTLARVAAHRAILADLEAMPHYAWEGRAEYGCPRFEDAATWAAVMGDRPQECDCGRDGFVDRMRRRLATAYAGREGWREEWKPQ